MRCYINWKAKLCSIFLGIGFVVLGCSRGIETPSPVVSPAMSAVPTIPPEEGAIPELLLSSDTKYQNDPPITALLFMIDASKSVNEICSPEEQALTYQVPGMMISLFKSLSSYYENKELLKVGVLAFSSRVEPEKSPFPIKNASEFSDNFIHEYTQYEESVQGEGNNFPLVLQTGKDLLRPLQAKKKLLVLITDGWFIEADGLVDPTISELKDSASDNEIQLLFLRLDCPIDPLINPKLPSRYKGYNQQDRDNKVWNDNIGQGRTFKSTGGDSLIKSLFSYPDIQSLIPTDQFGWWSGNNIERIPIDLPGDTWKVKIGIASIGVENIDFVDNVGEEVDEIGKVPNSELVPYLINIKFRKPKPNCGEYKDSRYLAPKQHGQGPAWMFYWVVHENLDKYFSSPVIPASVPIINNEPLVLNVGPIAPAFPNGYESFLECYQLWISLVLPGHNTASSQAKFPLNAYQDESKSVPIPDKVFKDEIEYQWLLHQDFRPSVYVDIVKFPQDKARFGTLLRASPTIEVRFRPNLFTSNCYDNKCAVSIGRLEGDFYPTGEKVAPQVWAIFSKDYEELRRISNCSNGNGYPLPKTGVSVKVPFGAPELYAANLTEKGDEFITINDNQVIVELPEYYNEKIAKECGFEFISIQWERPDDLTAPYWKTIKCPILETNGLCEESEYYWVENKP